MNSFYAPSQRWPEEFVLKYKAAGYWSEETIPAILKRQSISQGSKIALVDDEKRLSYKELFNHVERYSHCFRSAGFRPSDRVLVQLSNRIEFYLVVFGCINADLIPVLSLPGHKFSEISHLAKASGASAYISDSSMSSTAFSEFCKKLKLEAPSLVDFFAIEELSGRIRASGSFTETYSPLRIADQVALLQISGGSTGLPKLIPRTHQDYIYSFRASNEICALDNTSVYLVVLPAAHNFPMSSPGAFGAIYAGAKIVLASSPDVQHSFDLILSEGVTHVGLVPPLALLWAEAAKSVKSKLSSLRVVQVGGAKLNAEGARRIQDAIPAKLQQVFGMAEGLVNYTRLDDELELIQNTQGRPISPFDEIRIVDEHEKEVPPGTVGSLWTRGPYTIRAYYNNEIANAKAFTREGFYKTGDLVLMRTDGYLEVHGRNDDAINRAGEKISCSEIEQHLLCYPGVLDAVVFSVEDLHLGEKICAFVINTEKEMDSRHLKSWMRNRDIAIFKVPDLIRLVDTFAFTAVGKVDRKRLREHCKELFLKIEKQ